MENIAKSTSYGCYLDCDFETAKYPDDKTHIVGLLAEYVYDLEQRILHYDERYIKLWNEIETLRECVSKEFDQEQKIADLEAKLADSEKKAYSRGHSQRDIANEIKLNALREDVANKEKRIVELKQQLAISEKALELACREITGSCEYCSYKTRIECPVEADCLDEKINYFKTKAKEIIKSE